MELALLKLDNSAFYGFRPKACDVKNAVVLVGVNAVRNASVSVSATDALPETLLLQDFEMIDFWKHSLADLLVDSYGQNPECNLAIGAMHPEVTKFLVARPADSSDRYAGLSGEIKAAHAFFLEDEF